MKDKKDKVKRKRGVEKEERERTFLERLGFVQMMFEFYAAPVMWCRYQARANNFKVLIHYPGLKNRQILITD